MPERDRFLRGYGELDRIQANPALLRAVGTSGGRHQVPLRKMVLFALYVLVSFPLGTRCGWRRCLALLLRYCAALEFSNRLFFIFLPVMV